MKSDHDAEKFNDIKYSGFLIIIKTSVFLYKGSAFRGGKIFTHGDSLRECLVGTARSAKFTPSVNI